MNSLERQLHLWLALSLIFLMALLWLSGSYAIRHLTEDFAVSRLEHDGESLVAALDFPQDGKTRLRWRRLNQVYNQPYSGHYYAIRFNGGADLLYSRSLWDSALDIPVMSVGNSGRLRLDGPADQKLLVWVKGFRKQGVDFTLAVAEDLTAVLQQQNRFRVYFAILAAVGLLGLLLIQRLVVRSAVRKLDPVRQDIKRLSDGETGKLSEEVPREVLPLVQEFNHLLQLLSGRVERSRHSLGNLAHALKGPLNFLLQYFDERSDRDTSTQDRRAREQVERIRQLMDRELKRSRLVGEGLSGQRFDPGKEMPDLVGLLGQVYMEKQLSIDYEIDQRVTPFGDREDMLELLGNLLDNACKWATSRVVCRLSRDEMLTLSIEDDGEGLASADLEKLVHRGVRLDESREGHGLGLSIVKDVVELYGGSIDFLQSEELGGLKVVVHLRA